MTVQQILDFMQVSIFVFLKMSMPILLIGLGVGILVSVFQTLTQLQESTLTFVPKVLLVFVALIFLMPFMYETIAHFFVMNIIDKISAIP